MIADREISLSALPDPLILIVLIRSLDVAESPSQIVNKDFPIFRYRQIPIGLIPETYTGYPQQKKLMKFISTFKAKLFVKDLALRHRVN